MQLDVIGYACPLHSIAETYNRAAVALFCPLCSGGGTVSAAALDRWQHEEDVRIANGG